MIRIIIISDTHAGTIEKLGQKLISRIKEADIVLHAGDADTDDFMSELKKTSKQLYAVRGNCDWGSDLPAKTIIEVEGLRIGLSHGTGNYTNVIDRMSYLFSDDSVNIIVFGHTHIPFNADIEGIMFLNPGSTGLNRNLTYGTFATMDIEKGQALIKIINMDTMEEAAS